MWYEELGNLYSTSLLNEGDEGSLQRTPMTRFTISPTLDRKNSMWNNKIGSSVPDLGNASTAGLNIPFGNPGVGEQEEGVPDFFINSEDLFDIIENLIDKHKLSQSNPADRVALAVLGELRQKVEHGKNNS